MGLSGDFQRQCCEFVSTQSSQNVTATECLFQGVCGADDGKIAFAMPEGIVDLLQVVDIAKESNKVC